MSKTSPQEFNVVVERDGDGFYIASVPGLHGCHTQARTLEELRTRVKEAIELCLEVEADSPAKTQFVAIEQVTI